MASGVSRSRCRSSKISFCISFRLPMNRSTLGRISDGSRLLSVMFSSCMPAVPFRRDFLSSDVYHGESKIVNRCRKRGGTN